MFIDKVGLKPQHRNIWRPLKGPVMDAPLTVCDARTLEPADMDRTTDKVSNVFTHLEVSRPNVAFSMEEGISSSLTPP